MIFGTCDSTSFELRLCGSGLKAVCVTLRFLIAGVSKELTFSFFLE